MPDFGHHLEFASFPEPKSTPPTYALDLAVQSERWGYDLVAIQDHPYQGGYLDTITLMSWVAAKTDRIRVVSNVLNMALRSPVIVAKTAATLDLLSDGRFELGLGAGFFWDAIESVGGRRLNPAQATTALEEAIDIIRGAWTAHDPTPLDYRGATHSVAGMQRGPSPSHPLPIWIGALKPRMLGLVGRKADGWTASLGQNQSRSEWQAASRLIDEAAARSVALLPRFVGWPRSLAPSGPPVRFSRGPLHSGLTNCFLVSLKTGSVPFCSPPTTDRLSNDSPRRSFQGSA